METRTEEPKEEKPPSGQVILARIIIFLLVIPALAIYVIKLLLG
jgi:hypothetical protein